jgi:alkaline phosphatase
MKQSLTFLLVSLVVLFSCKENTLGAPEDLNKSQENSNSTPKNIILLIGDGMGISQITAGMYRNGNKLELERCNTIGLIKTNSKKELITDSSAGATAFATGKKTRNGMISQAMEDSANYKTFVEYAEENKKATGIVVTSTVTHATPACFYAHYPRRYDANEAISEQFVNSGVDVLIGGGKKYFETRKDGRNLLQELTEKGYTIPDTLTSHFETKEIFKLAYLYSPTQPGKRVFSEGDEAPSRGPILPLATQKAIDILKKDTNGFFLLVEGSQIDWGGHNNDSEYIINEMLDFNETIKIALDYADQNGETLVIITADHETGGYAIIEGELDGSSLTGGFSTKHHSASMIPVFAYGKGAKNFSGIYDNTQIFYKMMEAFGNDLTK